MRFFDAIPRRAAIVLVSASLLTMRAQMAPTPSQVRPPALPGTGNPNASGEESDNPIARQMSMQAALKRNSQRQQQIVDDTAKLLQLAQQLKEEMEKSNKKTLSGSEVKKAEEIEKLAKSVKDKMREGQ